MDRDDEWHAAAQELGLLPFLTTAPFSESASFREVMALLGMQATRPTSTRHIIAGGVGDARVVLATYRTEKGAGHPSSKAGTDHFSDWTAVVTEIDPNLRIGLHVERATRFGDFWRGNDVALGVKVLDDALRIQAVDSERARELLVPRDARDRLFAENIRIAAGRGLFISDSMIGYKLEGDVTDVMALKAALNDLSHLRRDLMLRVARLAPTPYDVELHRQWAAFAESAELAFDPARAMLNGVVDGVPIEIAREGAPGRLQLAVRCRFPTPIPAQVRLTKPRPQPGFATGSTSGFFRPPGQYIQVGDQAFEAMFQVQGYPIEPAQRAFESAAFRGHLLTLASVAFSIELTHDGVSWFLTRLPASAAELRDHVDMAVRLARSREPSAEPTGPYR